MSVIIAREGKGEGACTVHPPSWIFHEKPLTAVRLANGDHGVVLCWLCENLHLDVTAQIQRIKRTEVIADDLLYLRIQTVGGHK